MNKKAETNRMIYGIEICRGIRTAFMVGISLSILWEDIDRTAASLLSFLSITPVSPRLCCLLASIRGTLFFFTIFLFRVAPPPPRMMIGFVNDDLCKEPRPCFISRIPDTSSHVVSSNDRQIINLNRETIFAEGV